MIVRIALISAALGLGAFALWHPAANPALRTLAAASPGGPAATPRQPSLRRGRREPAARGDGAAIVVYVAGAVRRPGLYRLRWGDRGGDAVARAGGLSASADAGGVNLAARAADGDEIYVPLAGESVRGRATAHRTRRRTAAPAPAESVDVNTAAAGELAAVPGIGRAIAQRIVEMREREGAFASLDELLDVAGMSQTRLERAKPYLLVP